MLFQERQYAYSRVTNGSPAVIIKNTNRLMIQVRRICGQYLSKEQQRSEEANVDVCDSDQKEVDEQGEASTEIANQQLHRSTRVRNEPKWFKIYAIPRTLTSDQPSLIQAMEGDDQSG